MIGTHKINEHGDATLPTWMGSDIGRHGSNRDMHPALELRDSIRDGLQT